MTEYKYYTITLATIDDSNFGISEIRDDKMNTYSTSDVSMNINDKTVDFGAILDEFLKNQNSTPSGESTETNDNEEKTIEDANSVEETELPLSRISDALKTKETESQELRNAELTSDDTNTKYEEELRQTRQNLNKTGIDTTKGGKSRFSKKKRHSNGNKSFRRHKK